MKSKLWRIMTWRTTYWDKDHLDKMTYLNDAHTRDMQHLEIIEKKCARLKEGTDFEESHNTFY